LQSAAPKGIALTEHLRGRSHSTANESRPFDAALQAFADRGQPADFGAE
jgi:hypothetical protein